MLDKPADMAGGLHLLDNTVSVGRDRGNSAISPGPITC